ncbi:HAMP domain-containing protein [Erythrobacter sp. SCSIO 43205]|uniref:methyl-accepting chemotaxis protein n=1 Tax=Erythrobacter sp. SCSIO 43205 TaxID=2779361 RepID=UPI001CA8ABDE|nr:methyl-accepting chemotaxis protein [Erythrobacter sp. SCSIO 43205]UAB77736.1 HAMP domain-containing protein [Erythrobacter sp. SCSIO 43205]
MTAQDFNIVAADENAPSVAPQTAPISGEEQSAHWLDRFSLAKKLDASIYSSALILLFVAFTVVATAAYFSSAGRYVADVAGLEVRTTHTVMELDDAHIAIRNFRDRNDTSALEAVQPGLDLAQENILYTQGWITDQMPPETHARVAEFVSQVEGLQRDWNRIAANPGPSEIAAFESDLADVRGNIADFARELRGTLAPAARDLFNGLDMSVMFMAIMALIAVVVGVMFSRTVNRNIVRGIACITQAMQRIAKGEVHTTIPGASRTDEIGEMARSLEVFRHSSLELSELTQRRAEEIEEQLARQQESAREMHKLKLEKIHLLEDLAKGFEFSVGELITSVSAASEQLKDTSAQMVGVAEGSSDQADSASSAMSNTSRNVTAAAAATDEFALSINEISQQAAASATLARDATNLVASANTRMDDLSSAAEEVGEIAELIHTIAQRTNLLALNASIEAARGGEAGRGFAVVASEVKELATQTSAATSSVAEKISAMQESTRASAGDLGSIYDQIGELEKVAVAIATAVDQQSVSGEELARNIDTVAEGSRQVSELLVALREASEETGTAAGDVVESANALGKHADDLREKASRFIADVRRSARELEAGDNVDLSSGKLWADAQI